MIIHYLNQKRIHILLILIGILLINMGMTDNKTVTHYNNAKLLKTIPAKNILLYVGSYTPKGEGIYIFTMNSSTGALKLLGSLHCDNNPSYLAVHPNRKWLFSVSEVDEGSLTSYRIKDSTTIEKINTIPTMGKGPCYLSIDNTGKYLLTAHYNSGTVVSVPIRSDGSLGNVVSLKAHIGVGYLPQRQSGPHAHSILPARSGNLVYSADLGLDTVYGYKLDNKNGQLISVSQTPFNKGSGPRHLAFHPNKKWMYVVTELAGTHRRLCYRYSIWQIKIYTIEFIKKRY